MTYCSSYVHQPERLFCFHFFFQGYKGRKIFIASQGPLDASTDDFWRMIWEHKVRVIVMVANLYERNRVSASFFF